jgi:hypothetical protein
MAKCSVCSAPATHEVECDKTKTRKKSVLRCAAHIRPHKYDIISYNKKRYKAEIIDVTNWFEVNKKFG